MDARAFSSTEVFSSVVHAGAATAMSRGIHVGGQTFVAEGAYFGATTMDQGGGNYVNARAVEVASSASSWSLLGSAVRVADATSTGMPVTSTGVALLYGESTSRLPLQLAHNGWDPEPASVPIARGFGGSVPYASNNNATRNCYAPESSGAAQLLLSYECVDQIAPDALGQWPSASRDLEGYPRDRAGDQRPLARVNGTKPYDVGPDER